MFDNKMQTGESLNIVVSTTRRARTRAKFRHRHKHKCCTRQDDKAIKAIKAIKQNVHMSNTVVSSKNTNSSKQQQKTRICSNKSISSSFRIVVITITLIALLQAFKCQKVDAASKSDLVRGRPVLLTKPIKHWNDSLSRQVDYDPHERNFHEGGQFQDSLLALGSEQRIKKATTFSSAATPINKQKNYKYNHRARGPGGAIFQSWPASGNKPTSAATKPGGKRSRANGQDEHDYEVDGVDDSHTSPKHKYPHLVQSTRPQLDFNSMLSYQSAAKGVDYITQHTVSKRKQRSSSSSSSSNVPALDQPASSSSSSSAMQVRNVNNKKCALILQRTYVRKLATTNDIDSYTGTGEMAGSVPVEPTGRVEKICLTFDEVNKSIDEAKRKLNFKLTKELMEAIESIEPLPKYIAQLGELNQEATKILTLKYDLSPDEILNGLPLIDMSRTNFWPICPLMVKPIQCDATGRFRSFTGHCNNLDNPIWGAAQTPFVRYLAPKHPDGIEQDRVSALDESQLPPPRLVTSQVHHDSDRPSSELSLLIMVWGQFIDHDVAQAAPPRNDEGLDFNCCRESHPNCKPIEIPENDPLYSRFGQRCMDFKRSLAGLRPNCALGPRVHINTITSTIDGNTIYGSTKDVADQLRTFSGGLMKVQNSFDSLNLKPLLPKQLVRPDLDCFERPNNAYCFLAGDDRVNEQPTLTVMHTILVRDHNRLASQLEKLNPHWDDDRIYHETRHIVAAKIQNILVGEYLPMLIGTDMLTEYNLTRTPRGSYWQGYSPNVMPSISQGFTTAAFRQGHTFIQGKVRLHDSRSHNFIDSILLRRLFKRPFHYYQPGRMDQVLAGIVNTPAQTYDPFITEEISGHLFEEPGLAYGMDLPAINLARGREQGVPGYNLYREWCGLPRAKTFEQLMPFLANQTAYKYSTLYKHVDDIDLWSGGVSEYPIRGGLVGPTFACIIARQFANIKRGDRFWFENTGFPSQFTLKQLDEIKKATLARVICKNSDNMRTIQRQALKLAHPILNPRVLCRDIPDLDLKYWREDPNKLGSFST